MTENTEGAAVDTETVSQNVIGNVVDGVVVHQDGKSVVELDGAIAQLAQGEGPLEAGYRGEFFIETHDGDAICVSLRKAQQLSTWDWIQTQITERTALEATVLSESRGGLAVLVNGLNGLLPEREFMPGRENRPQIGEVIQVLISQYRDRKNHLFVSEKGLVEGSLEERKEALLADLEVGQVLTGEVRRFASFGAFVDLGGLDALLHVKDLAWRRIDHPREVISIGDVMTLQVLDFDRDTEKVSVGAKQLIPDPWLDADERYPFNLKVRGRVVGMSKFGAFVMLDDGIEGLAHVSEMSWTEKIQSPKEAVTVGDIVDCWVVRCEVDRRRLALSLKDPDNNPWLAIRDSLPIGTEKDFVISKVVDFGLFVELDGGLDGLIHVSDFSWAIYEGEPSEEYTAGETIRAIMLDIDEERGRANLGIKQLCADLTTELMQKFTVGQTVEVKVTSIQEHGLYAALKDGLDGFLPAKGLPEAHRSSIDENYENGQVLTAVITVNDLESKRVELELAEGSTQDHELVSGAVDEPVSAEQPEATDTGIAVAESETSTDAQNADGDATDVQANTSETAEIAPNEESTSVESVEVAEASDEDTNA